MKLFEKRGYKEKGKQLLTASLKSIINFYSGRLVVRTPALQAGNVGSSPIQSTLIYKCM